MAETNFDKLKEYFLNEAAGFQGKVAYLYADTDKSEVHFEKYSGDQVVSASMIKVPVMLCVFHLIEKGNFLYRQNSR